MAFSYKIDISKDLSAIDFEDINISSLEDKDLLKLLLASGIWQKSIISKDLFKAKNKIEDLGDYWYKLRDQLFPNMKSGSRNTKNGRVSNRAGLKLEEILISQNVKLEPHFSFVDLCGAPGSFIQLLISRGASRGTAISIDSGPNFYSELYGLRNLNLLTGDVCDKSIFNDLFARAGSNNFLVTADGGFDLPPNLINFQELLSAKLILAELTLASKLLKNDGVLILKLFSTSSDISASIIYILASLFDSVKIVKPPTSRITNSERYALCEGYRKTPDLNWLRSSLFNLLDFSHTPIPSPDFVSFFRGDSLFKRSLRKVNEDLSLKQIEFIEKVANSAHISIPN